MSDTLKLFYLEPNTFVFSALVTSCSKGEKYFEAILDQTAFYPEGGGQKSDTGFIGDAAVLDVRETDKGILHLLDRPLKQNARYDCRVDRRQRFLRMQNHTAEHIVSGLVHSRFGYENVGFHLNDDEQNVTFDFDGIFDEETLLSLEKEANEIVFQNLPVRILYPESSELCGYSYRSKLDLTENVRLVEIEGVDLCACCAPHVAYTGEIGFIKLYGLMKHRGGVRLNLKAGFWAEEDTRVVEQNNSFIGHALSVKPSETADAVQKLISSLRDSECALNDYKMKIVAADLCTLLPEKGNICFFSPYYELEMLRAVVNAGMALCDGLCAAFSGSDADGYMFVAGSKIADMQNFSKCMSSALSGRGGGRGTMIQGRVNAPAEKIRQFIFGGNF